MDVWEGGERGSDEDDEEEEEAPKGMREWTFIRARNAGLMLVSPAARRTKAAAAKPTKKTQPASRPAPPSAYRPAISSGKEDDFMASLLSSVAASPAPAPSSARARPRPSLGSAAIRKRKSSPDYASPSSEFDPPSSDGLDPRLAMPSSEDGPGDEDVDAGAWGYRSKKPRVSGASVRTIKAEPRGSMSPPPPQQQSRRGVSFAADDEDNKENVQHLAAGSGEDDDDAAFALRADRNGNGNAAPPPKARLFALNGGGNKVKAEAVDPAAARSRRAVVNSTSVSAKAAAAAAAAAQKAAEETAQQVAADDAKSESKRPAPSAGKSWQHVQAELNVGQGAADADAAAAEDEDDQYNASVKLRAAKRGKAVPGLNPADAIDAFERAEPGEAGALRVEGDAEERTLRMYWLDFHESERGVVHLIGKVLDRATGRYVSACVSVDGIQRNLFVLPRPTRVGESASWAGPAWGRDGAC